MTTERNAALIIATTEYAPFRGGLASYSEALLAGFLALGRPALVLAPEYDRNKASTIPDVVRVPLLPVHRPLARRFQLARALWKAVRARHRPVVLATTYLYAQVAAVLSVLMPGRFQLAATLCGPELIGHPWWSPREWWRRVVVRLLAARCRTVICISQYSRELALRSGIPSSKIRVIPVGVDTEFYRPAEDPEVWKSSIVGNGEGPLVLTVARLERRKGHDTALETIALLRERYPRIRYVIVGVGDEEPRLRSLARQYHIEDLVVFCGRLSRDDVRRAYTAADIFLLLTRQEGRSVEAQGLVLIEAGLCGAPVVVGRHGGAAEVIEDGVTGLVVAPRDPKAAAQAVTHLLESDALRHRIIEQAQVQWPSQYGIGQMVDLTVAALREDQ